MHPGTMTTIDCSRSPVDAALHLARSFSGGARLAVWAPDAADHARHVEVEFVHPVVAGTKPLQAVAVEDLSDVSPDDILLAIGAEPAGTVSADLVISDDQDDIEIVRSYHVLWELVHVALEHPGLVGGGAAAGGDSTGFLYPFLDASEDDEAALRGALEESAEARVVDSTQLVTETLRANAASLEMAARAVAEVARAGGRVHTMGNGGSACDAARLVRRLRGLGVPANSLASGYAVVTALANDVGVERVFSRQIEALTRAGDLLVGLSTSGASANLLAGFRSAVAGDLTTIGISGYGGASFAAEPSIQIPLAVASTSVHRIQEAQAALMSELCSSAAEQLATPGEATL